MTDYSITIKTIEEKGVLDDITDVTTNYGVNIRNFIECEAHRELLLNGLGD